MLSVQDISITNSSTYSSSSTIRDNLVYEIYALSSSVYASDIVCPPATLQQYFDRNPCMFWLARDKRKENQLVAYLAVVFVASEEAFRETFTNPNFDEFQHLPPSVTTDDATADKMYWFSIVVLPEYRGRSSGLPISMSELLIRAFYLTCVERGWDRSIARMSTMTLSGGGAHLAETRFGMRPVVLCADKETTLWYAKCGVKEES